VLIEADRLRQQLKKRRAQRRGIPAWDLCDVRWILEPEVLASVIESWRASGAR
jgi:hypothetical protein